MTRTHNDQQQWVMLCDQIGCPTRSEAFPKEPPLELFRDRGWFIARTFGDICPACLAKGVRPSASVKPWRGVVPAIMTQEATQ